MRFVSHEVRTPLNSVCMGLKLLRQDLADLFNNCTELQEERDEISTSCISEDVVNSYLLEENEQMGCHLSSLSTTQKKATDIMDLSKQILSSATNAIDVLNGES